MAASAQGVAGGKAAGALVPRSQGLQGRLLVLLLASHRQQEGGRPEERGAARLDGRRAGRN